MRRSWSESSNRSSGNSLTCCDIPLIRSIYDCWYRSASLSLMMASPRRSSVNANRLRRSLRTDDRTSSTLLPAMNRRAIRDALVRALNASARLRIVLLTDKSRPTRAAQGSLSRTSSKYSSRCLAMAWWSLSIGRTSTKRNICTLTASSPMAHDMSRSSHHRP